MSDPAKSGYECCGHPMTGVELSAIADEDCAVICTICGLVWRHLFSPGDARRAAVEQAMPDVLFAMGMGTRGDVE